MGTLAAESHEVAPPSPIHTAPAPARHLDHAAASSIDTVSTTMQDLALAVRTPTTGFTDLPTELLCQIFLDIPSNFTKTLWSLSLTCKRFHDVIEERLEPEHNLRRCVVDDPYSLIRRLTDRPALRTVIRSVKLASNISSRPPLSEAEANELVGSANLNTYAELCSLRLGLQRNDPDWLEFLLLMYLPRLDTIDMRLLHTQVPDLISQFEPYKCSSKTHWLSNLTHLRLVHLRPEYDDCLNGDFLALPGLQRVYLNNVIIDTEWVYRSLADARFQSGEEISIPPSTVTDYEVRNTHLHAGALHRLCMFTHLSRLSIRLKQQELGLNVRIKTLFEAIKRHKHSLRALEVWTNEMFTDKVGKPYGINDFMPYFLPLERAWETSACFGYFRPIQSLRPFTCLKSLALTDIALVGQSRRGLPYWRKPVSSTAAYLSGMLPTSLEIFTHILWDGPDGYDALLADDEKHLRSWDRIWKVITPEQFPNLKRVETVGYNREGISKERKVIWERKN
ncbi:hypothetical protein P153DRAFT_371014 [Dothidotthia symphoricarpi CBS 119687]|uniref:F-box domain-containing protein n=1 Tax=Dothidotthia symphoricarpi CBS 119687 TaxID=1392245 RepID=A0A6A5ZZE7_9PLEO|nr:uncharacterized protein P153DRAFT_371014 [Dothidotthia symphoricarpi CBS 119687]KAF2124127.1 hypothetical protein P153DRAFT_371014 [Dothidotthia symphoricarpi CBS 119687]